MKTISSHQATSDLVVELSSSPRTFPRRSTDYQVTVVGHGRRIVAGMCSSEKHARQRANAVWSALRSGVAASDLGGI